MENLDSMDNLDNMDDSMDNMDDNMETMDDEIDDIDDMDDLETKSSLLESDSLNNIEKTSPIKTFRSNPDIENFYRFVYENNLRKEAKLCLDTVVKAFKPATKKRGRKKKVQ